MRIIFTIAIFFSIITHGFSVDKPKKPKGCTTKHCSDWDWKNKNGIFDPHTIKWPLHHTGEIYKDYVDGGEHQIDVVFHHYGKGHRMHLKDYRGSQYYKDPWFLDEGIKMKDALTCEYGDKVHEPKWEAGKCAMVGATYEDLTVEFDGPSCAKTIRKWSVVDWCKWEPNGKNNTRAEKYALVKDVHSHEIYFSYGKYHDDIEHDGWYTFDQVIKVVDNYAPDFTYCESIEVDLEGSCETKLKLRNKVVDSGPCPGKKMEVEVSIYTKYGELVEQKWYWAQHDKEFTINTGYLSEGDYLIHWSVKDGCQNKGTCDQWLTIKDKNPPHLICITDLSTSINRSQEVSIWAKDFVHKVSGSCGNDYLSYSFEKDTVVSSLHFGCPDGPGIQELEVWVTDKHGNQSSCNVTLAIADHNGCDPTAMSILGKITDKFNNPIENATVMVEDEGVVTSETFTGASGYYDINGISFESTRPMLKVFSNEDNLKGIDQGDLVLLLRHVQGVEAIKGVDALAAADVNSDGEVDMEDYWDLLDHMYNLPGRTAEVTPWKFYDEEIRYFGVNANILVKPVPLRRFRRIYSMIGLKTGDIDFSWRPGNVSNIRSARRSSDYMVDAAFSGMKATIDIPNVETIYSIKLNISEADFDQIESVRSNNEALFYTFVNEGPQGGLMILSKSPLNGEELIIEAAASINLGNAGIVFEQRGNNHIVPVDWKLAPVDVSEHAMEVSPNPFSSSFQLDYESVNGGSINIDIFTVNGQRVFNQKVMTQKGVNNLMIEGDKIPSGVLIISVQNDEEILTKRIVKQ